MPRLTADLIAAVTTAVLATALFVLWPKADAHWAATAWGHALGVVGVLLMLWAGLAYSFRKRQQTPGGQPMRVAMQHHIVAGVLGPYLVILHSGFAAHGLAGALTLTMVLVVASGVVGRAAMAAVPVSVELSDPVRVAMLDAELARLETRDAELARQTDRAADESVVEERSALRRAMLDVRHEQELLRSQWMRTGAAAVTRRTLSVWWMLHVPASAALWVMAGAHVVAVLYYRV